jgi:hypothetical protein
VTLNMGGSVHDPHDPVGRLLFNVLGMIAEFGGVGKNRAMNTAKVSSLLNTASRGRDHVYRPRWRCRNGLYASYDGMSVSPRR